MQLKPSEISSLIQQQIANVSIDSNVKTEGTIINIKDGIVNIHGLGEVMYGEMISMPGNSIGMALNLERDSVGAVILGDYKHLREGDTVFRTNKILECPVGKSLLGRVVDALGRPIDGKGELKDVETVPIEEVAPGVIARQSVSQPMPTGIKAIDSMIPIGRGQRELIIGDRQTGKTAIAIDTIINQAKSKTGIKCIYVAIGQKSSSVAAIVSKLKEHDALENTIIVSANAAESAAMQFIAPYSGCSMGEYFLKNGEDALIVYDDLSKHAVAYRQISLLLRRPPGREAFPGDVFYIHSRLLERSARVSTEHLKEISGGKITKGTGSLTALPIIETQAGDVSAFVPTNVISITDGQIYLDNDLFNAGIRPAINAGLSVSRVGGAAQTKIIKKLGGGIRLAAAQFRELEAFAQFASDLDDATKKQLQHGYTITEILKQNQFAPMSVSEIAISLFIVELNLLHKADKEKVTEIEAEFHAFIRKNHKKVYAQIDANPKLDDEIKSKLLALFKEFAADSSFDL